MIKATKISKSYNNQTQALSKVSFEVENGQVVYILGESGSGKSTLLKIIAGLEDANQGSVLVDNEKITGPADHLVPGYDHLAYVPQDFKLQQFWTVRDNIGKKISHYSYEEKSNRIDELLNLCKLKEYGDRFPRELSGGQQQRIAMAAAVVDEPDVVLLDEPFSNLDLPMKSEVRKDIIEMFRAMSITVLLVSHDPAEALAVADHIIILNQGRVEQSGHPVDVYRNPKSQYAAKFLGPINEIKIGGKNLLIRPESLEINSKGKYEAKVEDCVFMGMHFHLTLKTTNQNSTILGYTEKPMKVGTTIKFDIKH